MLQLRPSAAKKMIFLNNVNIYLFWLCLVFVAACWLFLIPVSRGYSLVAVLGLLMAMASLVSEHSLQGSQASEAVGPRL